MPPLSPIFDVMTVPAPDVPADIAAAVAERHWGVNGTLKPLSGERDRNFHLTTSHGRQYVLKFANPAEPDIFRAMQTAILAHIAAKDPDLAVPRTVQTRDGALEARAVMPDGATHPVRLLTWIEGIPFGETKKTVYQRIAYGRLAARLQAATAGFAHPGAKTPIIWDLQHARHLREVAYALREAEAVDALEADLAEFEARVLPRLSTLRRQVLHDDLNRANVLVDPLMPKRMAGVIDFGDTTETAIVFDLAIACTSQYGADMPMRAAVCRMLRAYADAAPIPEAEAALMPLLIRLRMMMSVTLGSWHRRIQPDNAHHSQITDYVERTLADRRTFIGEDAFDVIMAACGHFQPRRPRMPRT